MYFVREPRISGTLDTVFPCVIYYNKRTRFRDKPCGNHVAAQSFLMH